MILTQIIKLILVRLSFVLLLYLIGFGSSYASENLDQTSKHHSFTPEQVKQIETVIHDYLVNNPNVLIEAGQSMQKTQLNEYATKAKAAIPKYSKELFAEKSDAKVMLGSQDPDVIVVEFFSYQCPMCRMMHPVMKELLKANKKLQLTLISLPFEGESDMYAGKAVAAANKQGKFHELYNLLMANSGILTNDIIDKAVAKAGLDKGKIKDDMESNSVEGAIRDNFKLAQNLSLSATPAFIIANKDHSKFDVLIGRATKKEMQKVIKEIATK
jgi:protein-disulfide isomerase